MPSLPLTRRAGPPVMPGAERFDGGVARMATALLVVGVAASVKIALANVILGIAFLLWLTAVAAGARRWSRSPLWLPAAAWVVATLAATAFSLDPVASLRELGELLTLLLLPMAVTLLDVRTWHRSVAALAAVASASAVVGLVQYAAGASDLGHRLRGLTTHYMTFSGWTLVVILLLVADAAFHPDRRRLRWTVPVAGLCVLALLLSFTRSAWVGLAAGLALVLLLWRPRALLLLPSAGLLVGAAMPSAVRERAVSIVDLQQPSVHDRLCMARSGLDMVAARPLTGLGMGMVQPEYPRYRLPGATRDRIAHLHCNAIQIAAERGLLGLAAYIALLAVFASRCAALLRRRRPGPEVAAVAGCLAAVAGVTVAGLFDYTWGDAEVWIPTLLCLAAPFAFGRMEDEVGKDVAPGPAASAGEAG